MNDRDLEDMESGRTRVMMNTLLDRLTSLAQELRDVTLERDSLRTACGRWSQNKHESEKAAIELQDALSDFVLGNDATNDDDDARDLLADAREKLERWAPLIHRLLAERRSWGQAS